MSILVNKETKLIMGALLVSTVHSTQNKCLSMEQT